MCAPGGVGLLLAQIAKALGARVLGVTSSAAKAAAVREAGADAVVLDSSDWVAAARQLGTAGADGVDVAYDSVGITLPRSFEAVRTGGHVVFYGMAGGDPPLVDPRMLMDTSKRLTGGDLWNVLRSAEERRSRAAELFAWVRQGSLKVSIAARFPLAEGAAAHAFLESRQSLREGFAFSLGGGGRGRTRDLRDKRDSRDGPKQGLFPAVSVVPEVPGAAAQLNHQRR